MISSGKVRLYCLCYACRVSVDACTCTCGCKCKCDNVYSCMDTCICTPIVVGAQPMARTLWQFF